MGYNHLSEIYKNTSPEGPIRADFKESDRSVLLFQVQPEGAEMFIARDPVRYYQTSSYICRYTGKNASFVTVLEPYSKQPSVQQVSALHDNGVLKVKIRHQNGEDSVHIPEGFADSIILERYNKNGKRVFREEAVSDENSGT